MDKDLYHQIQYDRIDHLETRRENFSNYILTISTAILGVFMINSINLNLFTVFIIFIFGFTINLIGILFIKSTMPFIKMHQLRADNIRKKFDLELAEANDSIIKPKPKIELRFVLLKKEIKLFSCGAKRYNIYIWLHWIIILFFATITIHSVLIEKEIDKTLKVKII